MRKQSLRKPSFVTDKTYLYKHKNRLVLAPREMKISELVRSLIFWIVVWGVVTVVFNFDGGNMIPLLKYLPEYNYSMFNINLNFFLASGLVVSIICMACYGLPIKSATFLGVVFEFQGNKQSRLSSIRRRILSMPFSIPLYFAALQVILLLVLTPVCKVPGVLFSIRSGVQEPKEYTPNSIVSVNNDGSIVVYVREYPTQKDLVCSFGITEKNMELLVKPDPMQYVSPCVTTVYPKEDSFGDLDINVSVSGGKYCKNASNVFIRLNIK